MSSAAVAVRESSDTRVVPLDEARTIAVLQNSLYPGASEASIRMVLDYCTAAGLDPLLKPVHIVPLWDAKARQMRDVIMPGVNLYRINAARTGECAGISEPEFGPMVSAKLGGEMIEYPEWAKVTVKRVLPSGIVAEFVAKELWIENYAQKGGPEKSPAPNAMWRRRVFGQLGKCAQAQALRMAFPEHNSAPTAEEMEGKPLDPSLEQSPTIDMDDRPQELVMAARAAADNGTEAYREWWQSITRQQRTQLQGDHAAFRVRAQAADAKRAAEAAAQQQTAPPADEPPPVDPPQDEFLAGFQAEEERQAAQDKTKK